MAVEYLDSKYHKNKYLVIPYQIVTDSRISPAAQKLLVLMLMKGKEDPRYKPDYTELCEQFPIKYRGKIKPCGRHTMQRHMNELIRAGYVDRRREIINTPITLHTGEKVRLKRGGQVVWYWTIRSLPKYQQVQAEQEYAARRRAKQRKGKVIDFDKELWGKKSG